MGSSFDMRGANVSSSALGDRAHVTNHHGPAGEVEELRARLADVRQELLAHAIVASHRELGERLARVEQALSAEKVDAEVVDSRWRRVLDLLKPGAEAIAGIASISTTVAGMLNGSA